MSDTPIVPSNLTLPELKRAVLHYNWLPSGNSVTVEAFVRCWHDEKAVDLSWDEYKIMLTLAAQNDKAMEEL